MNSHPIKVIRADIDALRTYGYSDEQIMETVVIVGFAKIRQEELADLSRAPEPLPPPARPTARSQQTLPPPSNSRVELSASWLNQPQGFAAQVFQFIQDEGVAALIQEGRRLNDSGVVRAMGVRLGLPPSFVMAAEHYDRIARLLEHGATVRLEIEPFR